MTPLPTSTLLAIAAAATIAATIGKAHSVLKAWVVTLPLQHGGNVLFQPARATSSAKR